MLGSEISATTVEIVFETTGSPDTTMMSAEEEEEEELSDIKTTQIPESAEKGDEKKVEMDFLKKMAKQALQRKFKKVKKPKQLVGEN